MSNKKKKFGGYIIAAIVVATLLGVGYATGHENTIQRFLFATGLILLAITILVTIHELGHLLTARLFGMRVETFSIGFPPRIFSIKKGDTEYQLGATPLGGYVKIAGMIDESYDTDFVGTEPKSDDFRSKPVWQRMIVMLGGVVMNVMLGIMIFSMLKFAYGDLNLPISAVNKTGIRVLDNSIGDKLGFETGDKVLTVNGKAFPYLKDYQNRAVLQQEGYYEVERGGQKVKIDIPSTAINFFSEKDTNLVPSIFEILMPCVIDLGNAKIQKGPAATAGLLTGDIITRIDSQEILDFYDLFYTLKDRKETAASSTVGVEFLRNGETQTKQIELTDKGKLGVGPISPMVYFKDELVTKEYGFFESFNPGSKQAFMIVGDQAIGMSRMADSEVETGSLLKGPIQIAGILADTVLEQGIRGFLWITGVLSMILAFMNILPIPALDGGHLVFLLYEAITRREPSVKVKLIAQQVGLVLVLVLMAWVLGNDIWQSIF